MGGRRLLAGIEELQCGVAFERTDLLRSIVDAQEYAHMSERDAVVILDQGEVVGSEGGERAYRGFSKQCSVGHARLL